MARGPIPWDISPDEVAAAYERLKPRLAELWAQVFPHDDAPYTAVVIPSVTATAEELERHGATHFYEEVLLFLLIRLRNPRARVVYVTSRPLPPPLIDYYLQFLAGIPASHAAARLTLLSAHDASDRPLTEKILERPRLVARIRAAIADPARAYMTVFRATELERRLAVLLDIPLNATDTGPEELTTKSGSRRAFREAGVPVPAGREGLRDEADVVEALRELRAERPAMRHAILTLERSYWEEGHAVVAVPEQPTPAALREELARMRTADPREGAAGWMERFRRIGGVAEELHEDTLGVATGQVHVNPRGQVTLTSTHDELRGGRTGVEAAGCRFPCDDRWRLAVQGTSLGVARTLAARGVVSRLSLEYLVVPGPDGQPALMGTEVNLGFGGSTHPLLAVRFLTGGRLDPETGVFHSPTGKAKYYRATDRLESDSYRRLLPEDLIEIVTERQLHYSPQPECGVLFYMLGALSELGRVGVVAIGNSRAEADAIYQRTVDALDVESNRRP